MKPTKHTNETNRQKILLKQTKQLPEFNKWLSLKMIEMILRKLKNLLLVDIILINIDCVNSRFRKEKLKKIKFRQGNKRKPKESFNRGIECMVIGERKAVSYILGMSESSRYRNLTIWVM